MILLLWKYSKNECTLVIVGSYIGASSCRAAVTIDNLILVVTLSRVKG